MKTADLTGPALDWAEMSCHAKVSRYMSLPERVHAQSLPMPNGCRIWQGSKNQHGYGMCKVGSKSSRAHRALHFYYNPQADKAHVVMHTCDTPACVNPAHLKAGTVQENVLDMHTKGRFNGGAKPGNQNSVGNQGWRNGGIVAQRMASKLGDEIEIPEELKNE